MTRQHKSVEEAKMSEITKLSETRRDNEGKKTELEAEKKRLKLEITEIKG